MDMIKVVCGIIYKDNEIFLCRRKPKKVLGGYWEFPGGKIEEEESFEDCLKRELVEELEMKVDIEKYFNTIKYDYENRSIELIAYICKLKEWKGVLNDHDKFEWVKACELLEKKLSPADIPLAKKIQELK